MKRWIALPVVAAALLAGCTDPASGPPGSLACGEVMIYGSAGSGGGGTASAPAQTAFSYFEKQGIETTLTANPYDANQDSLSGYEASVERGARNVKDWVSETVATCPDATLFLIGFSQGAHATHEALTDLKPAPHVYAVLLANPVRSQDPAIQDYVVGGVAPGLGDHLALNGYAPTSLESDWRGRVLSMCHSDDMVCNSDSDSMGAHGSELQSEESLAFYLNWLDDRG